MESMKSQDWIRFPPMVAPGDTSPIETLRNWEKNQSPAKECTKGARFRTRTLIRGLGITGTGHVGFFGTSEPNVCSAPGTVSGERWFFPKVRAGSHMRRRSLSLHFLHLGPKSAQMSDGRGVGGSFDPRAQEPNVCSKGQMYVLQLTLGELCALCIFAHDRFPFGSM